MISIELDNTKDFMSHLFIKETFDHFLCREFQTNTFVSFTIDGRMFKDFLNDIEKEELKETDSHGERGSVSLDNVKAVGLKH